VSVDTVLVFTPLYDANELVARVPRDSCNGF